MIKTIEKYPFLTLFIIVMAMLLPHLGHLKVTIMEARNFIAAREMLNEGNWILTTMNGAPRYEKPPLPTWITAAFGFLFGIKSVFALRLPGVIMVWLIGVYSYLFSRKLLADKMHALINGFIVITSFYVAGIIIEAPWDIYTHGFMLMAIYYLYLLYIRGKLTHLLLATVFVGCSVLSKGPVSMYALLLPFLIAYAVVYKFKNKFLYKSVLVLIFGAVLGGIWFYYIRVVDTESFLKIAFVETANWTSYNIKPFYYYWSFFIQSGIWAIPAFVGLLYPYLKNRVSNKQAYHLSFLWTIFAVILLSLVPEKKSRYLMPVLIPLAINTGFYIYFVVQNFDKLKKKIERVPIYFHFGLLGLSAMLFPLVAFILFEEIILSNSISFLVYCLGLFFSGSFLVFHLYFKGLSSVFYISIFNIALLFVIIVPLNPGFANQNIQYKSIATLKTEAASKNISVYYLDLISPEMLWDYGGIIPQISKSEDKYKMPLEEKFGVLVTDTALMSNSTFNTAYTIQHVETYDINMGKSDTRKHKRRYISNYYIFQKRAVQ